MFRRFAPVIVLVASFAAPSALAQAELAAQVKEHTLKNGMKWLIVERPQAPVFTGYIRIRAGGLDEQPGQTGLAHLFEHMAFKGTPVLGTESFEKERPLLEEIAQVGDRLARLERAGKGDSDDAEALRQRLERLDAEHSKLVDETAFTRLYQLNGAVGLNATTDKDLTSYFVSFPKNRLELWALSEAARLASPVLRDFYQERNVVMEERRMRTESQPGGVTYEELIQTSFTASPYRWPTVGYTEDLAAMTIADAVRFHRTFYVPSNAVGCIAGDVTAEEVIPLLERTFGAIPRGEPPPQPVFAEVNPRSERRSTVYFDAEPRVLISFRKPNLPHRDDYVFDLLDTILGSGRTSRLYQRLVLKDRLVQSVGVYGAPGSRLDNLFVFSAIPLQGKSVAEVEAAIWSELERLKTEKVSARELQKARNRLTADTARALDSNDGLASSLSFYEAVAGDWRYVLGHAKVIESITPEELQEAAKRYFVRTNATVVELQRLPGAAAAKGGAR